MEKRTIVFALSEPNAIQAILKLKENKDIELCAWLGVDKGQGVIDYDYGRLLGDEVQRAVALSCPKDIYDKAYTKLWHFLNISSRTEAGALYKYVNMFNMLINFYYGLFTRKRVNLLIFGDIPHFEVDSTAKILADAMGIKTVMFMQMHEKNRFCAFTDIYDVGIFNTVANSDNSEFNIEEKYEKDLFYMKDIEVCPPTNAVKNEYGVLLKKTCNIMKKNPKQIYTKGEKFILRKVSWKASRKLVECEYADLLEANIVRNVNLHEKFVYFPLHLQPEMTTSVLGEEFCDQVLAIERLREMLPEDWKIYIKENPKQSYFMRDELFFRRLKLIPNAYFVSREVNTYDLIKNSQFVATITGTAGWEAISGGKCVLVFGLAWYRKLPGVFEYKDGISVTEIMDYRIVHEKLVEKYTELMSKSYRGVLECEAVEDVENYSDEKNNIYLYEAFRKILSYF